MLKRNDILIILTGTTLFCVILLLLVLYRYTFDKSYNRELGYYVVAKYKDKSKAAKILHQLNIFTITLLEKMKIHYKNNRDTSQIVDNLVNKYDPDYLEENDPIYTIGHKTFTLNFQRIAICLRKKDGTFYDMNTLQFVMMHELSHIAAIEKEHNDYFWLIFKVILQSATQLVGYTPVDYSLNPITYCGISVSHNPYFGEYDISKYLTSVSQQY